MNVRTIIGTALVCALTIATNLPAQDAAEKTLEEKVAALEQLVGKLTNSTTTIAKNQDATNADVAALVAQVNELETMVRALVEKDSQGNPILRLRSNMDKSEEFRQEFGDAVHRSIRKEGSITVNNKTATAQSLKVNNRDWLTIPAGETKVMKVPVGTVTTELVGQESPKSWAIGAPDYSQAINIEPSSQVTVYRPTVVDSVSEVTVLRPTIVEPVREVTVFRPTIIEPVQEVTVFRTAIVDPVPQVTFFSPPVSITPIPAPIVYRTGLFGRGRVVVAPPAYYWP